MIVIHNSGYNPRIDFIVCKQLLSNLPAEYDEISLRNCFFQNTAETDYEKSLLEIKKHFEAHSADKPQEFEAGKLLQIIMSKRVDISNFEFPTVNCANDVEKIARYVSEKGQCIDAMFQVLLLLCYCRTHDVPLLPYHGICRKLYYSVIACETEETELTWQRLLQRKQKYCNYHDLSLNKQSVELLKTYKREFLMQIPDAQLAIFGSLANGLGTSYSDLDIMVVIPDDVDKGSIREFAYKFWAGKIPISFDVSTATESEVNTLPIAIRRSLRILR